MNAFAKILGVLSLAAFCVACGGGGAGTSAPPVTSANANLAVLSLGGVDLEQPFDPNQTTYTALVGFLITSIHVEVLEEDGAATLTVNGVTVDSEGVTISLGEGDNDIVVQVTAANGTTTRTYTITITRQSAAGFAQEAYIKASNAFAGDHFGLAIALSGNTLAVGAHHENSGAVGINGDQNDSSAPVAGAVYVFVRDDAGTWSQQAYIKASNTEAHDWFGSSVAIEGDTLAVGAIQEQSSATGIDGDQSNNDRPGSGAAYIYRRNNEGVWSQEAYVKASRNTANEFGVAMGLSGDTLAVGSRGGVYVFARDSAGTWSEEAYREGSNTEDGDSFANSDWFINCLAIDGDTLVVGAAREDSGATGINGDQADNAQPGSGAVYVFVRDSARAWSQQAYVKASNTDAGDLFGWSVALSDDTLIVGAPFEDSAATGVNGNQSDNSADRSGAAYIFARGPDGGWSQQAYVKPSNTDSTDNFGWAVAAARDTVVVGARFESSNARGINGQDDNNRETDSGAAYVFARDGSELWSQTAYLKASNADRSDQFGWSMALSSDLLAVGVWSEDSIATGINGDQTDNSAPGASAVYIFGGTPSRNANLAELSLEGVGLDQIFDPNMFDYTAGVGFLIAAVRLDVVSENPDAAVIVNGVPLGSNGVDIFLAEGDNSVQIDVVASDGVTMMIYTVAISRETAAQFAQSAYVKASNTGKSDRFGVSVALSGDMLAVGAAWEDGGSRVINGEQDNNDRIHSGAVYVFERDESQVWSQTAYIKAPKAGAEDLFGRSVALSGNTLAVGAPWEDSHATGVNGDSVSNFRTDSGAVYIFEQNDAGFWQHRAYIKASNTDVRDRFGWSLALSGDTLAVSAVSENSAATGVNGDQLNNNASDSGAVYVFTRDKAGFWTQEAYVKASNTDRSDYFGAAVALSGDTLVVGAANENSAATGVNGDQGDNSLNDAGAVYVFARDANRVWSQQAYIKASTTQLRSAFGGSLSLSGNTLAVGATGDDEGNDPVLAYTGAVYVFGRNDAGDWSQKARIKAGNLDAGDRFGSALAMSADTLAVGAWGEDSATTGISGDTSDNSAESAGAVYVFTRDPAGAWLQDAYVKSSNTQIADNFGGGLAIDGDTLAVAAIGEDSAATGIDGDQADNGSQDSGAVYVFK